MRLIFLLLYPFMLFADVIFSNIPPAKIEVVDINPESCSTQCLYNLSKENRYLEFIARFDKSINNEELQVLMEQYSSRLGLYYKMRFDPLGKVVEVALLMPKKVIGKYSTTTIDTILAYLLSRDLDFRFKIFDSVTEDIEALNRAIMDIKNEHFNFVIALLSNQSAISVLQDLDIPVYIPTITGNNVKSNIIFGGIDYEAQIEKLLQYRESEAPMIVYNDDSTLGSNLGNIVKLQDDNIFISESISNKSAANFSSNLSKVVNYLDGSNIFLNTPVVKSGLILSQINVAGKIPSKIFSTQVNYNPLFLSLAKVTKFIDNIIIASSIGFIDEKLLEYGNLLSSNMKYDWVNYSTALGIDLFIHKMGDIDRLFKEKVDKNQVIYDINLYKIDDDKFVNY